MISIHMTTYARYQSGLLPRAIESVLSQDFGDFELIVCDDASSDGTEAYLREVTRRDSRVRVHRHQRNINSVAHSLGECLQMADTSRPWVSWMFDDCILTPGALRLLAEGVQSRSVDMLFGSSDVRLSDGGVFRVGDHPPPQIKAEISNSSVLVPNAGILIHRRVFDQVGWYDPSIVLRRSCDWDLFRRIIRADVRFDTIPETLVEEEGELQTDSLRNAFTTTFDIMAKFVAARDAAGVKLSLSHCLSMPVDWIPPAQWTAAERALMTFMFLEYYLSVGDMAKALRWAGRLESHLPKPSLTLKNLRLVSGDPVRHRALMAGGAYAAMTYGLYKQLLAEEGRVG